MSRCIKAYISNAPDVAKFFRTWWTLHEGGRFGLRGKNCRITLDILPIQIGMYDVLNFESSMDSLQCVKIVLWPIER